MFTGIVEQMGIVSTLVDTTDGRRLTLKPNQPLDDLKLGDSISVNGCCLTAVDFKDGCLDVEISHETLRRTTLGSLKVADQINLERPLRLSDRLGGHLVSGHVDATGKVVSIKAEGFSRIITFSLSQQYAPFFIEKGSVTIDGVSLTVMNCHNSTVSTGNVQFQFSVALIPHTLEVTPLGNLQTGQSVNIETDMVAKYLNHWLSLDISLEPIPSPETIMRN
jgi:riboflavin synthase